MKCILVPVSNNIPIWIKRNDRASENSLITCVLNYLVGLDTESLITSLHQLLFIVYASIKESDETSLLHSLVKALAGRLFDKN